MSRSSKKGPYVDLKLLGKVEEQKENGKRTPIKNLGAQLHRGARFHRPHLFGSQW